MANDSLRTAITNAGGTPTKHDRIGLWRELVTALGGTPTRYDVIGLMREAITARGGTPSGYNYISLLRQLVTAMGGTPSSHNAWSLMPQIATLASVPTYIDNKLYAEGDSLTAAGSSWPAVYAAARPGATVVNAATGGHGISNVVADLGGVATANPEVFACFLQANDLSGVNDGATIAENLLSQIFDPVKAQGRKVVGFTSTPQAAPAGNPAIHNPRRAAFDAAMRAALASGRLNGLVDVAADPVLGPTAAGADTALYGDGIHMTAAGYARLGTIAIPVLDAALGYASDTTPNAFTIPPQTNAAASTLITSGAITLAGFDTPTTISADNGAETETTSGYFTTSAQLVPIAGAPRVRLMSSATPGGVVTSTVTVGGVTSVYSVTTINGTPAPPTVNATGTSVLYTNNGFSGLSKTWTAVPFTAGYAVLYVETDGGGRDPTAVTVNGVSCTMVVNHGSGKKMWISSSALAAGNYDVVVTMSASISQIWVPYCSIQGLGSTSIIGSSTLAIAFRAAGVQTATASITQTSISIGLMCARRTAGTVSAYGPGTGTLLIDYGTSGTNAGFFWATFTGSGQPRFTMSTDANSQIVAAAWDGTVV